jgi:hypothetical protein
MINLPFKILGVIIVILYFYKLFSWYFFVLSFISPVYLPFSRLYFWPAKLSEYPLCAMHAWPIFTHLSFH